MKMVAPLVSLTLLVAAPASAQELIQNGDFEASAPGTTPASWRVDPAEGGTVFVENGAFYQACCGVTSDGPNQFAAFGINNAPNLGFLQQDFATVVGQVYTLSFDFGAVSGAPATASATQGILVSPTTQTMAVTVADDPIMGSPSDLTPYLDLTLMADGSEDLATAFSHYTYQFTAQGTNTRLTFANSSIAEDNADAIIDNVSVDAVPEPASWATVVAGLWLAGLTFRARRRAGHRATDPLAT